MTAATFRAPRWDAFKRRGVLVRVGVAVVLVLAVVFGTNFVSDKSDIVSGGPPKFSQSQYGKKMFPKVQAALSKRAVPAATLAAALRQNPTTAAKKYGVTVSGAVGPELTVSLTGTAGKKDANGIYTVAVPGPPKSLVIRVQTGPAINGTDLRDATGTIQFGQFTNQIDYQNAAAGLNQRMKTAVLAKVDAAHLTGKKITVVGAFQLINPNGWLLTPAKLTVG